MINANKALTVLVTGAGAPGTAGTIHALRNNPDGLPIKVVAVDMHDEVVGKYLADAFYTVPFAQDPAFISSLFEIVKKENVDVVLPQVTHELSLLAQKQDQFESVGVKVIVSSYSAIQKANNKLNVLIAAEQTNVPYPQYRLTKNEQQLVEAVNSFGYPANKVVVKPLVSNGMRGLRIISSQPWDVKRFLEEKPQGVEISLENLLAVLRHGVWPELIVSEYLPGPEYSVDMFRGKNLKIAIPRLRKQIRSGITFQSLTELRKDLIDYSLALGDHLDLRYCFGFQFKLDKDGTPKVLECNPRVQGTMVAGVFAGFNLIYYAIKEIMGEPVDHFDSTNLRDGLRFLRYWGGVAVHEDTEFLGRF